MPSTSYEAFCAPRGYGGGFTSLLHPRTARERVAIRDFLGAHLAPLKRGCGVAHPVSFGRIKLGSSRLEHPMSWPNRLLIYLFPVPLWVVEYLMRLAIGEGPRAAEFFTPSLSRLVAHMSRL
jgi:hypothetical protein